MAKTAGDVSDMIVERVYGSGGVAHTQAFVISLLSKTQRVANAFLRKVRSSTALAVPKEKLIFKLRDDLSSAIDVTKITETRGGHVETLDQSSLYELMAYDADWFRNITSTRYITWTQIGRDLLVLYPGMAAAGTATVHYTKLTTALTAAGDLFELPDEDVHVAADLAEIILLARDKQISVAQEKLKQLAEYLGLEALNDQE